MALTGKIREKNLWGVAKPHLPKKDEQVSDKKSNVKHDYLTNKQFNAIGPLLN